MSGNLDRKISVLLVDDHSLVRRGFRRMLEDEPDIEVVGEAGDGNEAVEAAGRLQPDVAVMDFALPGMTGAIATRKMAEVSPRTAVLILSMHSEPNYVRNSLDSGARGYLLKNALDLELVEAIQKVASGDIVLDSSLSAVAESDEKPTSLTPRELEVLQLIVLGKSNKEVAALLGVSPNTVAVHRANIMQSLNIHNTAELVVHAIRTGLVSLA
jgi:DNA-binding NarL/FixJ family response regulator